MIVAGFGFREAAGMDSLRAALELACEGRQPDLFATAAGKEKSVGLLALAVELGFAIRVVSVDQLRAQVTVTQSEASETAYGTGSVAEAAALAAAGPGARLIGARIISHDRMATCALAEGRPR
ncbi:cobalamin biosynthesis protein [Puniceibacterium sediminis]|uniref:Cobalt-precorrin 5A hydrolase n=1 Tax=Puniceibacterium sediminis TaxID=1608407 RepID=A0A238WBD4_9RHOB|nr:cobalamin biosynthesis protein [Puniceibacterium sediminis]SNR43594.1 cobalt-precorrin 5A hydrolase [Puniceibacterium sediminis]